MSSSCPLSHLSSQVDIALLLWLPPGCHGTEPASLEPGFKKKTKQQCFDF